MNDANACFLEHFTRDGILQALAGLHEPGDGGIAAGGPACLPAKQGTLAVGHQHDDGGVDAREEIVWGSGIGAAKHVAGALGAGG